MATEKCASLCIGKTLDQLYKHKDRYVLREAKAQTVKHINNADTEPKPNWRDSRKNIPEEMAKLCSEIQRFLYMIFHGEMWTGIHSSPLGHQQQTDKLDR